ncbi:MAG: HesB/IscA family protein [Candidatus Pelagibacterales bacterium]|jgi:iron-sulfur cluster assembly protein|nr:iron-sulfur cluster assembly accessory protein [Pelagibacteraceae bacterium]|tara:strand:+ start:2255 stop:2587 length:333 start_codon:yes stop_codon:yes gene_type:complete
MSNIINISTSASERIREIISKANEDAIGLRIAVKSGGCAGYSYDMDYVSEINPTDELVEHEGVKVFVDQAAIMFLLGSTMDFKKDKFKSGFTFINPNETERCGCGESFSV